MGLRRQQAVADQAEMALWQRPAGAQQQQAGQRAAEAEPEAGGEQAAQQQAGADDAQQRDPHRGAPAQGVQREQGHDVGQPRLDAGQRRRDGGIDHAQRDGQRGQAGDAVIVGAGVQRAFSRRASHGLGRRRPARC
ncbi:hypothetical protein D3C85_1284580 [compost metagenome]